MFKKLPVVIFTLLLVQAASGQLLLGIGSSTIAGDGAHPIDSSWLNMLIGYYDSLGLPVTLKNLGYAGATSFAGMPSSFATPIDTPVYGHPIEDFNITYGLSFNPDYVIIAYPSNDLASGIPMATFLSNLRTIYDSVVVLGKVAYVATTQPRNDIFDNTKALQLEAKDSIIAEFPGHSLDFWTPLADPVTLRIKDGLTDDDIHPNNAGHRLLFAVAKAANIIPITPLAVGLTGLTAVYRNQTVLLQWQSSDPAGPVLFDIQRSMDGVTFIDQGREQGASSLASYSWTDDNPLAGTSFYRIKLIGQGSPSYSNIISIFNPSTGWSIGKLYAASGSLWNVEIISGRSGNVALCVVDAAGRVVLRREIAARPPSTLVPVDLSGLANGEYFLQLSTPEGCKLVRPMQKR